MDKQSITGMLLMGLVIFAFMWLNTPSKEQREAALKEAQEAQRQQNETQQARDLITAEEIARIIPTVKTYGEETAPGVYSLQNKNLDLTYNDGDSAVTGVVRVGDKNIDVNLITANRLSGLTPEQASAAHATLKESISEINRYKSFAKFLNGKDSLVTIENDTMRVVFGSRGGRIASVTLKKYLNETDKTPTDVTLFKGDTNSFDIILTTADQRINTADLNFTPTEVTPTSVTMSLPLAEGVNWKIKYDVDPDTYIIRMSVDQQGMASILPPSSTTVGINWTQHMMRNEKGHTFEERNSTVAYKFINENPDELSSNKDDSESLTGKIQWVAFKNQFFSSVVIPRKPFTNAEVTSAPVEKSTIFLKDMTMKAEMPYSNADGTALAFDFFFGPNSYPLLSSLDDHLNTEDDDLQLNRLVPLGWTLFRWINQLIVIPVFTFLGKFIHNYGIIILLLTIFIKIILFPFTYKSYVSQAKMKVLAPEIKEINAKYPGQENAMKRQQETMALYSRAGASPLSGCLPMLLQMPVLIAMFAFFPSAIELRGQSFLWAHDLSAPDSILTLPFTIPFYGDHVSLFCLLMTVTNIIYTRITMASNPSNDSMPGMKWMMYLMPVMFLFFFNDYASGLSYYYFLSLLITILQTYVIRHYFVKEEKVRAQMVANAKKPRKKSGFMARLEEAQKRQEAMMRQQAKAKKGKK